jgi:uncharacterized membrane protein YgcG
MPTSPLKVDNTAFLIEKLASDCAPLQYVRELTVNAIQAIQARRQGGWNGAGEVHWDVDWPLLEQRPGVFKLQISDNGTGMTGPEIERYINSLSASGRVQGLDANYGLGAKITAGVLNPAGLVYKSWVDGVGAVAILHKDAEADVYGLQQLKLPDGNFGHHSPISDEAKAPPIDTNGTAVVLFGQNDDDITMKPAGQPLKWLIKYLNTRFYEIPDDITIKVRDFSKADPAMWPSSPDVGLAQGGSQMRTVKGMKRHLEEHREVTSGTVDLKTATVRWHILPESSIQQSDIWETAPHCAAIFQGELYELRAGRSAYGRIRDFGVVFGYDRIVLYVEPKADKLSVTANTARSQLVVAGGGLPWDEWAAEFRQQLPKPIQDLMDGIASKAGAGNYREAIRRRLRDIRDLFRISRYRRSAQGGHLVSGTSPGGSTRSGGGGGLGGGGGGGGGGVSGGGAGNLYGAFISAGGDPAAEIAGRLNDPDVKWVSVGKGRAADDELDDRAARYDERQNIIYANADFRVFTDFTKEVCSRYGNAPPNQVKDMVEEWFAQQLIEAVLGVQALKGSPAWDTSTLETALSPEALTTAVMPRYNTMRQITRSLGAKLGAAAGTDA